MAEKAAEPAGFQFDEWATAQGFTNESIDKLRKANLVSIRAIAGLTIDEINELRLPFGCRSLFRSEWLLFNEEEKAAKTAKERAHREQAEVDAWIPAPESPGAGPPTLSREGQVGVGFVPAASRTQPGSIEPALSRTQPGGVVPASSRTQPEHLEGRQSGHQADDAGTLPSRATTASLARDADLQNLVDSVCNPVLKDFLSMQECEDNKGEARGLFPYFAIPDFLKNINKDKEEVLQTSTSGAQVVLKTGKKKPLPEDVSISQWIGANQRIYAKLLPLFRAGDVKEYGDYVEQVSELLTKYPASSVFKVDDLHRREVAEKGVAWNSVNIFNHIHYLRDAGPRAKTEKQDKPPPSRNPLRLTDRDGEGRRICLDFNGERGCRFRPGFCNFRHVCSVTGCVGDHPSFKHGSQGAASGKQNALNANAQPFRRDEPNAGSQ